MWGKTGPEALVKAAARGDKDAFTVLIDLHRQSMYATAMAVTHNEDDALDAIGDTILILWEKLRTLRNPDYFKTWMTKVLVNRCCTMRKKGGREYPVETLPEEMHEDDLDTSLDVKAALERLSCDDRLVLQLFYFEDQSVAQIADIFALSTGAVKMRLTRGRQRFMEQYGAEVQYQK